MLTLYSTLTYLIVLHPRHIEQWYRLYTARKARKESERERKKSNSRNASLRRRSSTAGVATAPDYRVDIATVRRSRLVVEFERVVKRQTA
jgi:hypothetical protein